MITSGSEIGCSVNQTESDAASESDAAQGTRRRAAVGLKAGRGRHYTPAEKLAARIIRRDSGCWDVQGYQLPHNGYVQVSTGLKSAGTWKAVYAHRLAYELAHGPIPSGLHVLHSCDNPRCANPDHLSLGTARDNMLDCIHKGRRNAFGQQVLTVQRVRDLRTLHRTTGLTQKELGKRFGIARNTVSAIVNWKAWAHLDPLDRVLERVPTIDVPVLGEVA